MTNLHSEIETSKIKTSEITTRANFSIVRYAQVWEDADILLEGLNVQPNEYCLSIASAGDNTLALLTKDPAKVIALDLNLVQLFCLELRVAAYKTLTHLELLQLMGSRSSSNRIHLYQKCRSLLEKKCCTFWDSQQAKLKRYGIGGIGKFERYFRIFKNYILPFTHSQKTVAKLFTDKSLPERQEFFNKYWNTWRWQLLIRLFFSKTIMGKLGRDPAFFTYVEDSFVEHVFEKIKYGMCELNPTQNPYLHWLLTGTHGKVLPFALREENFEQIRDNLHKLEWHLLSTETYVEKCKAENIIIDKFNLSNIFEYMSEENYLKSLTDLIEIASSGGRLLYWNMMAPRSSPAALQDKVLPLTELASNLHAQDKAIFYNKLVIEQVL